MKFHLNTKPQLTLMRLLKRRKMSLKQFILEQGITTYDLLQTRCSILGVLPPNKSDFDRIQPRIVTTQSEGIIVLEPLITEEEVLSTTTEKSKRKQKKNLNQEEKKKEDAK